MLNISHTLIHNLSNKGSTLTFQNHSHLHLPILHNQFNHKLKSYPKSLLVTDDSYSVFTPHVPQTNIEESILKSKRNKQSIEVKRSIIRKMNQKILDLQKKTKTQKIDIFELEACKNDLLLDFLQYEQSKRKHQQQIHDKLLENSHENSNSFIWTKTQPNQIQQIVQDRLENRNFNKKHSKILSISQNQVHYEIKPIQIYVPLVKLIDVEIPMLKIGQNKKIKQQRKIKDEQQQRLNENEKHFQENNGNDPNHGLHLPLNSSRSQLFYDNERRHQNTQDLNSDRSQQSYDYRNQVKSDRFFVQDQEIISKFHQKEEQIETHNGNQKQVKSITERSDIRQQYHDNKDNKEKKNSLIYSQELKLNSSIQSRKSSNYQHHINMIQNQTNSFNQQKIINLQQELRQKSQQINKLLTQNKQFIQQIQKSNKLYQTKQQNLSKANEKILSLQQTIQQLKKQLQDTVKAANQNQTKLINELHHLSNELQSKNQQLHIAFQSLETIQQNSYKKQQSLLTQIQTLQNHMNKMKDQVENYKQKLHQEGIKLNFTEIQMIEQAIEDTKKMYQTNIENLKSIYETQISQLKRKVSNIESQNNNIPSLKKIQSQQDIDKKTMIKQPEFKVNQQDIKQIIDLYDSQLQARDNEILEVRKQLYKSQSALKEMIKLNKQKQSNIRQENVSTQNEEKNRLENNNQKINKLMLQIIVQKNQDLQKSLTQQTIYRQQLNEKLLKLQKAIKLQKNLKQLSPLLDNNENNSPQQQNNQQKDFQLVSELTEQLGLLMQQLQKQKKQNENLRKKITQNKPIGPKSQSKQISMLKNKVKRLTKYSQLLQQQIKDVFKLSDCQVHNEIIERLQQKLQQQQKIKCH